MFRMPRFLVAKKTVLVFVLLILLLPTCAFAAGISDLWVTGVVNSTAYEGAENEDLPADAVRWWYSSKSKIYYLFLPSGADVSQMRIWFKASDDTIQIGEKEVKSGDAADFLMPGATTVQVGSKRYKLMVMQSATVPAMFITTETNSLKHIHQSKKNQETGTLLMVHPDGSKEYSGDLDQIKGRGSSSFSYPKKSYQIKLTKSTGLCGMEKSRTWVLLGNYKDNSLLRNKIAFVMAEAVGLEYTSCAQAVDLYVNNDYLGAYLLCEKVEIKESRIDINDLEEATEALHEQPLEEYPAYGADKQFGGRSKGVQIPNNPDDITGGYLLELEKPHRYVNEVSGFKTKKGLPVVIKEPEYASREQAEYAKTLIQSFENAIFSDDGIDPFTGKAYYELADMDSLVKKYVLEEVVKNFDANRTSFYLYKPEDSVSTRFFAGPVWDYDIAFGNFAKKKSNALAIPTGFYANSDRAMPYYWLPQLYSKPDFYAKAMTTYHEAFVPTIKALLGMEKDPSGKVLSIDEYAKEVEASAAMNFSRWQVFNTSERLVKTGKDYPENIAYLKDFLHKRMNFLNENWVLDESKNP